jgi:hypothetical protein
MKEVAFDADKSTMAVVVDPHFPSSMNVRMSINEYSESSPNSIMHSEAAKLPAMPPRCAGNEQFAVPSLLTITLRIRPTVSFRQRLKSDFRTQKSKESHLEPGALKSPICGKGPFNDNNNTFTWFGPTGVLAAPDNSPQAWYPGGAAQDPEDG